MENKPRTIVAKIDVTLIDKNRLFQSDKTNRLGKKRQYLDIVLIPTPDSEYDDYMVVQSMTKEERDKGLKGEILGNARFPDRKSNSGSGSAPKERPTAPPTDKDDVPF